LPGTTHNSDAMTERVTLVTGKSLPVTRILVQNMSFTKTSHLDTHHVQRTPHLYPDKPLNNSLT